MFVRYVNFTEGPTGKSKNTKHYPFSCLLNSISDNVLYVIEKSSQWLHWWHKTKCLKG